MYKCKVENLIWKSQDFSQEFNFFELTYKMTAQKPEKSREGKVIDPEGTRWDVEWAAR